MGFVLRALIASGAAYVMLRMGRAMLGGFARPVPGPPPEGEMRRLKLHYRCSLCGLEMRTERSATDDPDAPRHCMEDMDLVSARE